ncbi:hypothetical protein ARMGADRAFT_1082013 [Armillaria gallica]|uniref:Ubiquitin-like protease family profile domain-containing protein n=1 Tax=Armillaria gallica TaxID=47427 RepID=A0A2H3DSH8_ARMGA|nr:hypothetical protein ARMGADRAFT_1082013 [Armillaria gallica]
MPDFFKLSDWIDRGKKWADTPPLVWQAAKSALVLPSSICQQLLPTSGVSLHSLITFTLPTQASSKISPQPADEDLQKFFSRTDPGPFTSQTITHLQRLPIPSASTVHKLEEYSQQAWLDGYNSQKNDLLELVHQKLAGRDMWQNVQVETDSYTQKLIGIFQSATKKDNYKENPADQWLQDLGKAIVEHEETIMTVANLINVAETPHWVAVILDGKGRKIWYGDSFRKPIPAELVSTFVWWIGQHGGNFQITTMQVTEQQDGYNCGMLVDNALNHWLFHDKVPLLNNGERAVALATMQHFITVAEHVLAQIDEDEPFTCRKVY